MLVPILRAAHCRSTHHYFAIDALERLGTESGRRLGELLLKHYARYLKGAKAPDDSFKDFQNHVLHVSQNNWGGAPRLCQEWLDRAVQHMRSDQWSEAAYACGVLSHYFTDPIMPLHTGQTKRENVVHRPMEWSICQAYEEIYALCQFKRATYQLKLEEGPSWIGPAVIHCATIAHQHYQRLIDIYNLPRGVADPPRGLTKEARQILADLFDLAMGGWAAVLTRIATELPKLPPDTSLTLSTVIAGIDVPRAWVLRKFNHAALRAEVQRIFAEFTETGTLVDNLPAEIKVVQRELRESLQSSTNSPSQSEAMVTEPPRQTTSPTTTSADHPQLVDTSIVDTSIVDTSTNSASQANNLADEDRQPEEYAAPTKPGKSPRAPVTYDSLVADAPSVGPKTAKRLNEVGIVTIGDLVDADPVEIADALDTGWITAELIGDWQDQAMLVCEVPALCGYKAQLLVAIDCRTAEQLAVAEARDLHTMISNVTTTKEGQRILRSASAPSLKEVESWVQSAIQERQD